MSGHVTTGKSSWHAGSDWEALGNGRCCKVGEPAGALFDAAAPSKQQEYVGRVLARVVPGNSATVLASWPTRIIQVGADRYWLAAMPIVLSRPVQHRFRRCRFKCSCISINGYLLGG